MLQNKFCKNLLSLIKSDFPNKIAIAVSGGIDSMALLQITSLLSKKNKIELFILTVDHNLRENSHNDVIFVYNQATRFGHQCIILSWDHQNITSNLQERARLGRYKLMSNVCKNLSINTLMTAHHQDDMIETFLIRKEKKSGILGLSSSHTSYYNNIRIIRPLYNITKFELTEYLKTRNIAWVEDDSNISDKYTRNKIRKNIANLTVQQKNNILSEMQLVNTQAHELNERLIKAIAESVCINNFGFALMNIKQFNSLTYEIKVHVLHYVLTIISSKSSFPRYRSSSILIDLIAQNNKIKNSLHGCIIKTSGAELIIYKEINYVSTQKEVLLNNIIWDNRFQFQLKKKFTDNLIVTNLNLQDYSLIKNKLNLIKLANSSNNNHKSILFTLPLIKHLEKVIAIPHMFYYDNEIFKDLVDVTFRPNYISRFTHFF